MTWRLGKVTDHNPAVVDEMIIAGARLLGALVKHLSPEEASKTLKYVYC